MDDEDEYKWYKLSSTWVWILIVVILVVCIPLVYLLIISIKYLSLTQDDANKPLNKYRVGKWVGKLVWGKNELFTGVIKR